MNLLTNLSKRIEKFLSRNEKMIDRSFANVTDPRQSAKVIYQLPSVLKAILSGFLTNKQTLRAIESTCGSGAPMDGAQGISDTTLHDIVSKIDPQEINQALIRQIKGFVRNKMIKKPKDLSSHWIAIDGKNLGMLEHDGAGLAHYCRSSASAEKWGLSTDKGEYWIAPVLRAALISSEQRLVLLQKAIPQKTGEATNFGDFIKELQRAYGRTELLRGFTADAGLCSLENANILDELGYTYVFGLKGNQEMLHEAAQVILLDKAQRYAPDAKTDWERAHGKQTRRLLWKTTELKDFETSVGQWYHLRETWLVRQETKYSDNHIEIEERYFITNSDPGMVVPKESLAVVRAHWRIENDVFNTLDVQMKEDSAPLCRKGTALWVLSGLRLMAYNILQHLRRCHLRLKSGTVTQRAIISWQVLFESIFAMKVFFARDVLSS